MGNKAPKTHDARKGAKSRKRKSHQARTKDPVILVMERGLRAVDKRVPITDEDGVATGEYEVKPALEPKGLVLGPVQTMVLAKYIQQLNSMLEIALADDADDEDEDSAPEAL